MWDKIEKEFGISKEAAVDFALDLLGFIPGYGDYFDLLHGIKYWEEGDIFNAVCCFGSLIPLLGDGLAKGAKYTLKYLDDIGWFTKIAKKVENAKLLRTNADELVKIVHTAMNGIAKGSSNVIPNAKDLKMTETVKNHIIDIVKRGKYAGELSRPYIDSNGTILLLQEIMNAATPVKDAYLKSGLRWDVEGTFKGAKGTWELVVDMSNNTIVHFNFCT